MSENAIAVLVLAIAFTSLSWLTFYFSSRRKLFLRCFVPADELHDVVRGMRGPSFQTGLRVIAALQIVVAASLWIVYGIIRSW